MPKLGETKRLREENKCLWQFVQQIVIWSNSSYQTDTELYQGLSAIFEAAQTLAKTRGETQDEQVSSLL